LNGPKSFGTLQESMPEWMRPEAHAFFAAFFLDDARSPSLSGALPLAKMLAVWSVLGILCSGCDHKANDAPNRKRASETQTIADAPAEAILHVPVGSTELGSKPGTPGRQPKLEPTTYSLEIGPFRIDRKIRLDASGQPALVSSPTSASAACAQFEARLCTEVEWERACRADIGLEVPGTGEWTASVTGKQSLEPSQPVVRGLADIRENAGNCARRRIATASERAQFRCCYGAPNAPRLVEPEPLRDPPFRIVPLERAELQKRLAADPRTQVLAANADFFSDDAVATVLERGPGDTKGFELTTRPVRWNPDVGVSFLVLAGRADKKTAFVVVYHEGTTPPILASSFVMKNEKGPVVLAFANSIRPRLHFSTCWGCPGETGKALFREPESVVMLQP
jgi:hypothetical protein